MKRILLLTVVFIMMLGTSFSFAQADADNFYKSDWVKVEKVSFSNQYKMKVAGNLFLPKTMKGERNILPSLSDIRWERSRNRVRICMLLKWRNVVL